MQAHSGDGYPWLCRQAIGSMCSAAFPPNCLIPLTWGMRYADHAVQRTQRRCTKKKAQPPPFISLSHLALITYHLSLYLTYPPMLKNKCGDATPPTPPHPPPCMFQHPSCRSAASSSGWSARNCCRRWASGTEGAAATCSNTLSQSLAAP